MPASGPRSGCLRPPPQGPPFPPRRPQWGRPPQGSPFPLRRPQWGRPSQGSPSPPQHSPQEPLPFPRWLPPPREFSLRWAVPLRWGLLPERQAAQRPLQRAELPALPLQAVRLPGLPACRPRYDQQQQEPVRRLRFQGSQRWRPEGWLQHRRSRPEPWRLFLNFLFVIRFAPFVLHTKRYYKTYLFVDKCPH
mgnify:CR=1 FL=1